MIRSRYRRIVFFFARLLLSISFWDLLLPRLGLRALADRTRPNRMRKYAGSYRVLAVQMGGVLIKVGQFLSARVDVMPPEFTHELEGLQDEVPPENFSDIRRAAEADLGKPLEEVYADFEAKPLAAASLGQAHRARLKQPAFESGGLPERETQGFDVVVKVQRPNIEQLIHTDLAAVQTVGKWLQRYPAIRKRANVPALLDEFTRILYQEIDYVNEGHNAETFAENFADWPGIRVPRIVWTHTTPKVLTLENVWAIKITDYETIRKAGISRAEVASRLLDTYLKQVFEDGFFHADPHPGNLFVRPLPYPEEVSASAESKKANRPWELTFVDFGMTGNVPDNLLAGLRELLIGVGTRDSARLVKAYQMMDILLPGADTVGIERASTRVFDQFWGKNMTELSSVNFDDIKHLTDEFRDLLYAMPFQVPQNIVFLGRAVGILSGMCTGLDPNFNLWEHLAPFARKLLAEEAGTGAAIWLHQLETFGQALLAVPRKIDTILNKIERGEIAVRNPELNERTERLEHTVHQVAGAITFTALLLGGIQLYLGGETIFSIVLLIGAGLNLIWLALNGRRNRIWK
jgi:predicted unusual protein kinase regulating ubiquinone biosynthesis (AarF/ABC1/UbiB family)